MKPTPNQSSGRAAGVTCDVAAHGAVRLTAEQLGPLRQQLGPPGGKPLPAAFLKHVDDQTVSALAAVWQAVGRHPEREFPGWAVLAAPRFLGRLTMLSALQRFAIEGAWGVSPHLIPHRSLHSMSGTISQALQLHGPNFGVGGGPGCASEIFMAAAGLAGRDRVPGVWAVLTGWHPEPSPSDPSVPPSICGAVALALQPARPNWRGLRIRLTPELGAEQELPRLSLELLLDALLETPPSTGRWRLDGGGQLEVGMATAGVEAVRRAG